MKKASIFNHVTKSVTESLFAVVLLMTFFMLSCEKEIDWTFDEFPPKTIVVEAMLTNEFKTQQIFLSYPVANMNQKPEPVSNAMMRVSWNERVVGFTESDSTPGLYLSDRPFSAAIKRNYELTILKDSLELTAQSYMVPVLPFNTPTFSFIPHKNQYRLNWNNAQYSLQEQAMYEAIVHWDHLPGYNHPDSISGISMLHFTFNTIDVGRNIFPQDYQNITFPAGSIVYISKFSLNPQQGAYMRSLVSQTYWQGSLFESARGNLAGNISNGALGYFSTNAVIRDTIVAGN